MIKTVSREEAMALVEAGGSILVYRADGQCEVEVATEETMETAVPVPKMPEVVEEATDAGEDEAEE